MGGSLAYAMAWLMGPDGHVAGGKEGWSLAYIGDCLRPMMSPRGYSVEKLGEGTAHADRH
jgi:hypothetical protein